jgi:hypothetical protein
MSFNEYGHLKNLSDEDLYKVLQRHEAVAIGTLVYFCAEVLRRILEQEYKSVQADDDDD